MRILFVTIICLVYSSLADAGVRQKRNEQCDKQDTFFKHKHEYTYQYTITSSSSFVGATPSKAGFMLSCTVTIKVPKRCRYVLELSECHLQERQEGAEDVYQEVGGATDFLQDLQRYAVVFQMNKGLLVEGSINVDPSETLQVRNVKRGLLSALQFQILEAEDYKQPVQQKDIFGDCPTKYTFSAHEGYQGHTYRNLRECQLGQIYKKQFNSLFSVLRPVTGGYTEGPISEGIYPFVSDISCDYGMSYDQQLNKVTCLQQQYFKPSAFHGDFLATAMTNVSQNLVLQSASTAKLRGVDLNTKGLSEIDIRFDFGDIHEDIAEKSDIEAALDKLAEKQAGEVFSDIPGLFAEMVQLLRQSSEEMLEDLHGDMFSCYGDCDDIAKTYKQSYYLDGLESCGTDACLLVVLEVIENGQATATHEAEFYQGLCKLEQVSDEVMEKLWMVCDSSGKTNCWLTLGTILSSTTLDKEAALPADGIVSSVLDHLLDTLTESCDGDGSDASIRELKTAIKTLENIGAHVSKSFSKMSLVEEQLVKCLVNPAMPKSVRRSVLQTMEEQFASDKYKDTPSFGREELFTLLADSSEDTVLRTRSFSLLMKTTDTAVIQRLADVNRAIQDKQLKVYMRNAVGSLLESVEPDMREIKQAWSENPSLQPNTFYMDDDLYSPRYSKVISFSDFYKLPLSEYFGEQIYVDLVFDSASKIFSALRLSANFYYGEKKQQLFDVDLNIHGFDVFYEMMTEETGLTFEQLYRMYKAAQSSMSGDGTQFATFQKDIVDVVIKIIETANHPKITEFDIEFDLKVQGKNVMFISIQELLGYLRQMKQQLESGPSSLSMSAPDIINRLLGYMAVDKYKTSELVSLVKVLPMCAGLPLNMTVWISSFGRIQNSYNMVDMTDWKHIGAKASNHFIIENEMRGQLVVPVGLHYQSGMKMKIYVGSERHATFDLGYQHDDDGHILATLTLYPIPPETDTETLFYVKSRMYLLHQSGMEVVQPDPLVQTDYTKCLNGKFQMLLGRSLCANVKIPNVVTSRTHAYFPLSGPFDVTVTFAKVDGVVGYTWAFEVLKNQPSYDEDTYFVNLIHDAPGDILGRHIFFNITANRRLRIFNTTAGVPDLGVEYLCILMDTRNDDVKTLDLEETLWINKQPIIGYRLKGVRTGKNDVGSTVINTNFTLPGISWDLEWEGSNTELADGGKEKLYHLTWKWFCSKDRPLLYILHLSPTYAASNNDVTKLGFKFINTDSTDVQEFSFHLEFYETVLKVTLGKDWASGGKNIRLAYETGGVETEVLGEGTLKDLSSQRGLNYDYNLDSNSDQYNMVMTGNLAGHPADLTLTADLQYSKTEEDNEVNRRKRSLKSIYENLIRLEKAAAEKLKGVVDGMLGKTPTTDPDNQPDDVPTQQGGAGSAPPGLGQLPNMIPMFPSIWDMQMWNARLNLHSQLQPRFRGDPGPKPDGMELVLTLNLTHPWYGGYKVINNVFKVGKSGVTDFRHFWFWLDNEMEEYYTGLDGVQSQDVGGEPLFIRSGGSFNVYRQMGESFEFNFNQHGPNANMSYEILFDWDAMTHHEPLFHVQSTGSNNYLPFFNHEYREYLTVEDTHAIHSATFNHSMLNVSIDNDMYWGGLDKVWMDQDVNVSLMVFGYGGSFSMNNKAIHTGPYIDLQSSITVASMPDKTLIYTIGLRDPKTLFISGAVRPAPGADSVALWNMDLAFIDTTIQQLTITWTPALDAKMPNILFSITLQNALRIKDLADNIGSNIGKPIKDQPIWLVGVTPEQLAQKYVFPKLMSLGSGFYSVMANFVSLKERQAILDSPGPNVPPRLGRLLATVSVSNSQAEPSTALYAIQTVEYYTLLAVSYGYLTYSSNLHHSQALKKALKDREVSIGWTNWYIWENGKQLFPQPTEALKHVYGAFEDVFGYYRYSYFSSEPPYVAQQRLAVIFGRHGQDRPIRIQTFDQSSYEIPAEFATACSYLMAADLMNRGYAVVMTPQGLTMLTSQEAVTITWEKKVFVGDSKQESAQPKFVLDSGTGYVERKDDKITVQMDVGVTVLCYTTDDDVCLVALNGTGRNRTIGLLGNGDGNTVTDWRLLSGDIPSQTLLSPFLQEYVVSGPEKCSADTEIARSTGVVCNNEFETLCKDQFYKQYNALYQCGKIFNTEDFKSQCSRESWRCDSAEEDMCHVYRAYTGLCETAGLIKTPLEMSDVCTDTSSSKPQRVVTVSDASLDLVFVISDHKSMSDYGNKPWKYMQEVITADPRAWNQFSRVRLGVVGFAGEGDNMADHVVWLGDSGNEYFSDLKDFDWSLVEGMKGEGQTDTDGFLAVQRAAGFPFNPRAHKMIVLLITKEQGPGKGVDPEQLLTELTDKGIILNVVSTYAKVSSRKVIGINWEEQVITRKSGYTKETKALPQNGYTFLIRGTKGALWDLDILKGRRSKKAARMVEELITQTKGD